MIKKRYYSKNYIEKTIAKIDAMNEEINDVALFETEELTKRPWLMRQIKDYISNVRKRSYVLGFWMGYTLRDGIKDENT